MSFIITLFGAILFLLLIQYARYRRGASPVRWENLFEPGFSAASHRGFGKLKDPAENTGAAFDRALKIGVRHFETDVILSRDGVPVIAHGPTAELAGRLDLNISDLTLVELKKLNFAAYLKKARQETILTLQEFLEKYSHQAVINLEMKNWNILSFRDERAAAGITAPFLKKGARIYFSSFNPFSLLRLRHYLPEVCLGMLWRDDLKRFADNRSLFYLVRPDFLHPYAERIDEKLIAYARRMRYRIHAWVVNDIEKMNKMRDSGIDTFITDECRTAVQFMKK